VQGKLDAGQIRDAPDSRTCSAARAATVAVSKTVAWRKVLSAATIALVVGGWTALPAQARRALADDLPAIALSSLPAEARETDRLIQAGGPFPFPHKDGSVFANRERLLPKRPRGEYREYTVRTPGARDRGARRIVCAGRQLTAPEVCYYTPDHYSSFQRIER
jgi:ribonuclease T1